MFPCAVVVLGCYPRRKYKIPEGGTLVCLVHTESPATRAVAGTQEAITDDVLLHVNNWVSGRGRLICSICQFPRSNYLPP